MLGRKNSLTGALTRELAPLTMFFTTEMDPPEVEIKIKEKEILIHETEIKCLRDQLEVLHLKRSLKIEIL